MGANPPDRYPNRTPDRATPSPPKRYAYFPLRLHGHSVSPLGDYFPVGTIDAITRMSYFEPARKANLARSEGKTLTAPVEGFSGAISCPGRR